jgi:hypothetical protein
MSALIERKLESMTGASTIEIDREDVSFHVDPNDRRSVVTSSSA